MHRLKCDISNDTALVIDKQQPTSDLVHQPRVEESAAALKKAVTLVEARKKESEIKFDQKAQTRIQQAKVEKRAASAGYIKRTFCFGL